LALAIRLVDLREFREHPSSVLQIPRFLAECSTAVRVAAAAGPRSVCARRTPKLPP
jgi:hypothetical protein